MHRGRRLVLFAAMALFLLPGRAAMAADNLQQVLARAGCCGGQVSLDFGGV